MIRSAGDEGMKINANLHDRITYNIVGAKDDTRDTYKSAGVLRVRPIWLRHSKVPFPLFL